MTRSLTPAGARPIEEGPKPYYDQSWAVVVGINAYRDRPLLNARRDAEAVAALLRDAFGFQVHTLYDEQATRSDIVWWLRDELPRCTTPEDRVVFFFAGHGVTQEGERGYLVPFDAPGARYADLVDMRELQSACGLIKAKHILIVLDCCFSGIAAFTTRSASGPTSRVLDDAYLERITRRRARQILTAGASDERAADSGIRPGHSAFTHALLEGLGGAADADGDRIITASDLASYVKPQVSRETAVGERDGQLPFFTYLPGGGQGDFCFVLPDRAGRPRETHRRVSPGVEPPAMARERFAPETVLIPGGPFWMGSAPGPGVPEHETRRHEVSLPLYRIGKYPVTNEQYREFVRDTGHPVRPEMGWVGREPPDDRLRHPVAGVTFEDAKAYCEWLSGRTGRSYALPNEAQWEKAARGDDGRPYPWGNEWETGRCHHGEGGIAAVDRYPAQSVHGCYDMVGNVREWTCSLWGTHMLRPDRRYEYPWRADERNDLDASQYVYRVCRGGSAADDPADLRCSAREGYTPDDTGPPGNGFRVVMEHGGE